MKVILNILLLFFVIAVPAHSYSQPQYKAAKKELKTALDEELKRINEELDSLIVPPDNALILVSEGYLERQRACSQISPADEALKCAKDTLKEYIVAVFNAFPLADNKLAINCLRDSKKNCSFEGAARVTHNQAVEKVRKALRDYSKKIFKLQDEELKQIFWEERAEYRARWGNLLSTIGYGLLNMTRRTNREVLVGANLDGVKAEEIGCIVNAQCTFGQVCMKARGGTSAYGICAFPVNEFGIRNYSVLPPGAPQEVRGCTGVGQCPPRFECFKQEGQIFGLCLMR